MTRVGTATRQREQQQASGLVVVKLVGTEALVHGANAGGAVVGRGGESARVGAVAGSWLQNMTGLATLYDLTKQRPWARTGTWRGRNAAMRGGCGDVMRNMRP